MLAAPVQLENIEGNRNCEGGGGAYQADGLRHLEGFWAGRLSSKFPGVFLVFVGVPVRSRRRDGSGPAAWAVFGSSVVGTRSGALVGN